MNALQVEELDFLGLFELDAEGTVLYCRPEPDARPYESFKDLSGQNFFREVAQFENVNEFRHHVSRFLRSGMQADNFLFNCRIDNHTLLVRVLLARIRERADARAATKSVLVHIRKS